MSEFHARLADRLVEHIRAERFAAGHHLTEQSLEGVLRTSRSPVRGALARLVERGILQPRPPRRGLFLALDAADIGDAGRDGAALPGEERDYLALAADRLDGRLPELLAETEVMRRYGLTRERVRSLLARAAAEGWIERRPGKGWVFLPMIDGPEACAESYALRAAVEPAAMAMPGFRIDSGVLARLRDQQEALASGGYRAASRVELFAANASFHEALAGMSGNRFVGQVVLRQNQLRRLLEYRMTDDRARVGRQCEEHLAILDLLARGERGEAARRLKDHLEAAGDDKVRRLRSTDPGETP